MPGRYEPLEVFLREIEQASVTDVLCLVADEEIARKSPDYLAALQKDEIPATVWRLAIPDYGMPEDLAELKSTLNLVAGRLAAGKPIVIHCAAGHGRTGMVATLLLMNLGLPLEEARDLVGMAGSAPDTSAQRKFLEQWN